MALLLLMISHAPIWTQALMIVIAVVSLFRRVIGSLFVE
jgi:hypothetical protein